MLDGLECRLGPKIENCGHASGHGRPEICNVVDLEAAKRYAFREIDLDLVACDNAANKVPSRPAALLGDRENRRDVIAWMASIEVEEIIVVVQLSDSRAIGPRRPFAMDGPHLG